MKLFAGIGSSVSSAQAPGGSKLAPGQNLREGRRPVVGLYQAVDRDSDTIDFLLRAKRDHAAACGFFERAIDLRDMPEKITIDKSGADIAATASHPADGGLPYPLAF